jgi:hypothetical protein
MNEIEREELEQEQAAREDYQREAYGREVDVCNAADEDHARHLAITGDANQTIYRRGLFVPTTLEEFSAVLKRDKGWKQGGAGAEVVYIFTLKCGIEIKVYTGIAGGSCRPCGGDAIRVCAVNHGRGWIATSRINRTPGWQLRLQFKVLDVIAKSKARLNEIAARTHRAIAGGRP